jgi:hypothetical protein
MNNINTPNSKVASGDYPLSHPSIVTTYENTLSLLNGRPDRPYLSREEGYLFVPHPAPSFLEGIREKNHKLTPANHEYKTPIGNLYCFNGKGEFYWDTVVKLERANVAGNQVTPIPTLYSHEHNYAICLTEVEWQKKIIADLLDCTQRRNRIIPTDVESHEANISLRSMIHNPGSADPYNERICTEGSWNHEPWGLYDLSYANTMAIWSQLSDFEKKEAAIVARQNDQPFYPHNYSKFDATTPITYAITNLTPETVENLLAPYKKDASLGQKDMFHGISLQAIACRIPMSQVIKSKRPEFPVVLKPAGTATTHTIPSMDTWLAISKNPTPYFLDDPKKSMGVDI